MKKVLIIAILFYFLTLFQTNFLIHFSIWGKALNLVLILVIILNIFESSQTSNLLRKKGERVSKWIPKNSGIFGAIFGGFFLDIFSSGPIGFQILILLSISIFIRLILKRYGRIPRHK